MRPDELRFPDERQHEANHREHDEDVDRRAQQMEAEPTDQPENSRMTAIVYSYPDIESPAARGCRNASPR